METIKRKDRIKTCRLCHLEYLYTVADQEHDLKQIEETLMGSVTYRFSTCPECIGKENKND